MTAPVPGAQFDPFARDPYPFYARARAAEPVFYSPRLDMWCLARYDDIAAVLRDPQTYSSSGCIPTLPGRGVGNGTPEAAQRTPTRFMIELDPPEHTRLRRLAGEAFTPARVAALEPTIREVTDDLIDGMGSGPADLVGRFAYPLPLSVILRVLGVPPEDLESCRRWTQDIITLNFVDDVPAPARAAAARGAVALNGYAHALAVQRAAEPRDDLISHMMAARVRGQDPLSVVEAVAMVVGLVIAGHETTANLIGNLVWQLLNRPEEMAAVRDDPELIPAAVEEALRHDTSVLGLARTTTRDVDIAGARIPAGARLLLLYGSGSHDERRFPDAEEFRLDRPRETQHLAFGRGIHFCLGAPLARLESRIALERLLARLPGLRLADPNVLPEQHPAFHMHGPQRLDVAWDTRERSDH